MKEEALKVSFLVHNPPYQGGIVHYSILLANAMHTLVDQNVVGYKSLYPRFLYKGDIHRKSQSGIDFKAPVRKVLKWYSPLSWYRAYRQAQKSNVIHINWVTAFLGVVYYSILLFNRFGAKRKVIITCHNITDHEPIPFGSFFTRRVLGMAHQLIVHAPENKERLKMDFGISSDRVTIVPHGDFSFFTDFREPGPITKKLPNEIADLKQSDNEKIILFFGYIRRYKGLRYLLKAFPEILRRHPETRLLIAGECWEDTRQYENLIREMGIAEKVLFHPSFVPDRDVWKYFDVTDLVVLPYHNTEQTISGPLLVSMAFGKPTVVGNCGGIGNLVRDGEDALLIPGGDVEAIVESTVRLLEDADLREKLGKNAEEAVKKYDWAAVAKEIVKVYLMA